MVVGISAGAPPRRAQALVAAQQAVDTTAPPRPDNYYAAGELATAFFVGDVEVRLVASGPITTKGQHVLVLLAGVLTLAVLRVALGGVVVFISALFGLGALTIWLHQTYTHRATPAGT